MTVNIAIKRSLPAELLDAGVLCPHCRRLIPVLLFVLDGRPHAQTRCPSCERTAFLV